MVSIALVFRADATPALRCPIGTACPVTPNIRAAAACFGSGVDQIEILSEAGSRNWDINREGMLRFPVFVRPLSFSINHEKNLSGTIRLDQSVLSR